MGTFNEANERGKRGEATVKNFLQQRGWLVIDTSDHQSFQVLGIDLVVSKGSRVRTVDVKTDSYDSGNFFIEIVSNDTKGTEGCIYKDKVDDWLYYYSATDSLKVFSPKDMLEYISELGESSFRRVKAASYIGSNIAYHSEGLLVPNNCPVVKAEYNLAEYRT